MTRVVAMPTETDDPFEDENGDADEATGQTTARGQLELFPKRAATGLATHQGIRLRSQLASSVYEKRPS
jgi:hypothetical protein